MHREYNTAADRLSKRGLRIIEGYIFIDEFVEGSRISSKRTRYYYLDDRSGTYYWYLVDGFRICTFLVIHFRDDM